VWASTQMLKGQWENPEDGVEFAKEGLEKTSNGTFEAYPGKHVDRRGDHTPLGLIQSR
jgi:hypothetical protein